MRSKHLAKVRQQEEDRNALRLGAAALGMFAGLILGLVLAYVLVRTRLTADFSGLVVFGTALAGLIAGFLQANLGFGITEATAHFFLGYIVGESETTGTPSPLAPRWLRVVFWAGVVCGIFAFVVWGPRGCMY